MVLILISYKSIINEFTFKDYQFSVLRLDLIHPEISGNKWFKLKYNLEQAKLLNKNTILTFGGAFSNHIAATAVACKLAKLNCIGIIRGDESHSDNPTLNEAKNQGMKLKFLSRGDYQKKTDEYFLKTLENQFQNGYIIPEGGDNEFGQKGCREILTEKTNEYDHLFCACGTGTTFRGIQQSLKPHQYLTGINVLKFESIVHFPNAGIINTCHFGGYAKHNDALLQFKEWFETEFPVPLDYVYTAKLFYAVFDLMKNRNLDPAKKILIIHSGGLQGNEGYERRYNLNPKRQVNDIQG